MSQQSFTVAISVAQSPEEVFKAVTNVAGWWSEEVTGGTTQLNDEFNYHFKDVHRCQMRLTEVVPGQKMVWQVLSNYFNFEPDKNEWEGSEVIFEISQSAGQTHLQFTHKGLQPGLGCYEVCSNAWTFYVTESLYKLITTGKGEPNAKEV